CLRHDNYPLAF
nr:immunoglobulin light chain junction region [Macaca mulatta]